MDIFGAYAGGKVRKIRSYGTMCPQCKKLFEIGKIELESDAQLADLRNALSHQVAERVAPRRTNMNKRI